jgi:hypothetical protein
VDNAEHDLVELVQRGAVLVNPGLGSLEDRDHVEACSGGTHAGWRSSIRPGSYGTGMLARAERALILLSSGNWGKGTCNAF